MSDTTECKGRWAHAWHVRKFGGIGCGRCGASSSKFHVVNGLPVACDHIPNRTIGPEEGDR